MKNRFIGATTLVAAGAVALLGLSVPAGATARPHVLPTYDIAYQGPLSGGNAALGLNMVYSVQLAINKWNSTAGIHFKLALVKVDDQGDPGVAATVAPGVAANSKIVALVGPAFSGATEASQLAAYASAKLPLVSPSATNVKLVTNTYNFNHNFFRVVADDQGQGTSDAKYVRTTLKLKNIYVVNDGSAYGQGLAGIFATAAKGAGVTEHAQTAPSVTSCGLGGSGQPSEYPPLAAAIKNSKAQIVFYGGYYCDFGLLTSALHTAGYKGKLLSGDGSLDPHYIADTTPHSAANGAFLSCACTNLGTTAADKAFISGFLKLAHFAYGTYSAEAFDATNAILSTLKGKTSPSRAGILAALRSPTFKYVGITKTVQFASNGDAAGHAVFIYQVKSGKIVELKSI